MGILTSLPRLHLRRSLRALYDFLEAAPQMVNIYERGYSASTTLALNLGTYETKLTSSGAGTTQNVTIGAGTGAVPGQRKLVTLETRTHASDVISLDHANITNAAGTQATNCDLGTAGGFVLLEWTGAKWHIIASASATVAP